MKNNNQNKKNMKRTVEQQNKSWKTLEKDLQNSLRDYYQSGDLWNEEEELMNLLFGEHNLRKPLPDGYEAEELFGDYDDLEDDLEEEE